MKTVVRRPGLQDYESVWLAMREYTDARGADAEDEVWLLEHPSVYTLGLAGRPEHILDARGIPVVRSDRGGQVTYHGPGQLVVYLLLDLKRRGIGVKDLVWRTEQATMDALAGLGVSASRRPGAPGVYTHEAKIAALGFRVRRGCCYHGLAVNIDLDLEPFTRINPCGYPGLRVSSLREQGVCIGIPAFGDRLLRALDDRLGFDELTSSGPELAFATSGETGPGGAHDRM
ncbi:MAG: Octanoyltransferase [Gammaproteobacteria bacterium]|nr:Octanoyltransferase [Gammaproteobacteria bacterium]